MPPKVRPITSNALQLLLTRIGSASSGTKDVLLTRLNRDLWKSRLFDRRPDWKTRQAGETGWHRKLRVVSIDMGIKNLAYCDAEVEYPVGGAELDATINVIRWDKLDLVTATQSYRGHHPDPGLIKAGSVEADEDVDPYSLEVMSRTANWVVNHIILQARPDIILIERQRWRSASSAAIQQWTIRVNTLEAMIWAILETMKMERLVAEERVRETDAKRDYEVFGVDPKRVGQFWLTQHARALAEEQDGHADTDVLQTLTTEEDGKKTAKIGRSKAEKKAKIAILRSWLTGVTLSTACSTPDTESVITFNILGGAIKAREAFSTPISGTKRKSSKKNKIVTEDEEVGLEVEKSSSSISKLDDITDCFLQAAAWIAWESNRRQLVNIWEKNRAGHDKRAGLDDGILKIMNELVNGG